MTDIWADTPHTPVFQDIDRQTFEREIKPLNRPAVMKGLVSDWSLVEAGIASPEMLADFIRAHANDVPANTFTGPPEIKGRFSYTDDLSGFNFERGQMTVSDLLDHLLALQAEENSPALYAGGVPIPKHLPSLMADNPMPLLDAGSEMLVSAWIGNRTRIPAHWDLPQNIACVTAGRRRYTLFPPDQLPNLYVGPVERTLAGQPSSLVDFHAPDLDRFPKFAAAMEAAQIADLEPGDAVFVPAMWWHHVESFTPFGMLINYWWREGPDYMMTPLFTLLHALTTLRDMPEQEREAWRVQFDHYIFQCNGDPMAHLPEEARGLFGEMTPQKLQQIKSFLSGK